MEYAKLLELNAALQDILPQDQSDYGTEFDPNSAQTLIDGIPAVVPDKLRLDIKGRGSFPTNTFSGLTNIGSQNFEEKEDFSFEKTIGSTPPEYTAVGEWRLIHTVHGGNAEDGSITITHMWEGTAPQNNNTDVYVLYYTSSGKNSYLSIPRTFSIGFIQFSMNNQNLNMVVRCARGYRPTIVPPRILNISLPTWVLLFLITSLLAWLISSGTC